MTYTIDVELLEVSKPFPIALVAGAAAGGTALAVIVFIAIVKLRRRTHTMAEQTPLLGDNSHEPTLPAELKTN